MVGLNGGRMLIISFVYNGLSRRMDTHRQTIRLGGIISAA